MTEMMAVKDRFFSRLSPLAYRLPPDCCSFQAGCAPGDTAKTTTAETTIEKAAKKGNAAR